MATKYTLDGASLIDFALTLIARVEYYEDEALLELRELLQRNINSSRGRSESAHSLVFMTALIAFVDDELLDRYSGSI